MRRVGRFAVITTILVGGRFTFADTAIWDGSAGNWSDATRWSSNPSIPDNNGVDYDVTLAAGDITQDLTSGVTIDSLEWSGGEIAGANSLTVLNTVSWTGGALANRGGLIVPTGGTLNFSGTGTQHKLESDARLVVGGTVVLTGNSEFNSGADVGSAATVEILAGGLFDIAGDSNLTDTFFNNFGQLKPGIVENSGMLRKSAGGGTSTITDDWTLNNLAGAMVEVNSGTLVFRQNGNGLNNSGHVSVGSSASLHVGGGNSSGVFAVAADGNLQFVTTPSIVHVLNGATIDNAGKLELDGRVQFVNGASITGNQSIHLVSSDAELGGTSPMEFDEFEWSAGTLANSGGIAIKPGGTLSVSGTGTKRLASSSVLAVAGTATLGGSQSIVNLAPANAASRIEISPEGTFDLISDVGLSESPTTLGNNAGDLIIDGMFRKSGGSGVSSVSTDWSVNNNGSIEVETGTLRFFGPVKQEGAVNLIGGNIEFRGNVGGAGAFTGSGATTFLRNYEPGIDPAKIDVGGDLRFESSTAALWIEIGGTVPGTEFDQLVVDGAATLAGTLRVSFVDSDSGMYSPVAGDSFEILNAAGGVSGQFSAMLPTLSEGLAWQLMKSDTALTLAIVNSVRVLVGDYNLDGRVDAADYTTWRDMLGQTGSALEADGNGDEVVDEEDYAIWKTHFGEVSPLGIGRGAAGSNAVPEPSAAVLCYLARVLAAPNRAGHRSGRA